MRVAASSPTESSTPTIRDTTAITLSQLLIAHSHMTALTLPFNESSLTTQIWGCLPSDSRPSTEVVFLATVHVRLGETVEEVRKNPRSTGRSISDITKSAEQDDRKRAALQRARVRLARHLQQNEQRQTIASLRLARSLSQTQLADALGVSQSYIGKIESGRNSDLRATTIRRLAEALQVDANTILGALSSGEEIAG